MWGMTAGETDDEDIQKALEAATKVILRAQNVGGGWRYQPRQAGDMSVSGWAIMALKSAELSGLRVPDRTFAGIRKWLKKVSGGKHGGTITAAAFLKHFVADTPWAHLDIAGTSYLDKAEGYRPQGGTGVGVRLLIEYLRGEIEYESDDEADGE